MRRSERRPGGEEVARRRGEEARRRGSGVPSWRGSGEEVVCHHEESARPGGGGAPLRVGGEAERRWCVAQWEGEVGKNPVEKKIRMKK